MRKIVFALSIAAGILWPIQHQAHAQNTRPRQTSSTQSRGGAMGGSLNLTNRFGSGNTTQATPGASFLEQVGDIFGNAASMGNIAGGSSVFGDQTGGGLRQAGGLNSLMGGQRFGGGFGSNFGNQRNRGRGGGEDFRGERNSRQRSYYRPALSIAFSPPAVSDAAVAQKLNRQVSLLQNRERGIRLNGSSDINVTFEDRTAVLRGSVATAYERDLAERMASLQPGVNQVRNELLVEGESTPESPPPTE